MKRYQYIFGLIFLPGMALLQSCSPAEDNHTGHEFMPDMVHSTAYEANVYTGYYWNTWEEGSSVSRRAMSQPGMPVKGTVPRGYAGVHYSTSPSEAEEIKQHMEGEATKQGISTPMNGHVPFHYENTEDERQRAMEEITMNPYPITEQGLTKGGELYNIYCGICHGSGAAGDGYLVRDNGGKYPAQPAILTTEEFVNASEGRYYFSIMYGKNVMGSYADKLSYEERWQVIHYIRSLQAEAVDEKYNPSENTLTEGAIPKAEWDKQIAKEVMEKEAETGEMEQLEDKQSGQLQE